MIRRLIHISRPVLWINTIGTVAVGMWLSGTLWDAKVLPLLLWATLPFNLLIYGVNDVFDQETDALNPRKGSFGGARISRSEVRLILLGVAATNAPFAVLFALTLPADALVWISLYALVFLGYSVPPLRFKARPYLDSLSNAAYAFPLVFVPLALGGSPVWAAALGLMAWSAAKHTFDAVQDIDEDRRAGLATTATQLGPRGVVLWSGLFWTLSTALFALVSVPVALVVGTIAAFLLVSLQRKPSPATGRRLYPVSIAYPYLAGTFAGVLLVAALALGVYG
ncbi:UbiA family prenyltransferase [Rubrobacter radiotolerans]|uniref:UbiA family prenyltransferase n=1 Tax=Rubrobacter radiotolerans TaxID=42256 RepID=A0AB35T481_RUBRA|nr:UbiA family prenyltransferase [Rubrobacter radiotolerans]MDX5894694.1 UbiA family prenyltransferase [Rubrobacter radiotolerans]SMC06555.1 4-hydroxybenzoate polyprenyltransferase [Rubrobacter radiotolerans DSM 5868]